MIWTYSCSFGICQLFTVSWLLLYCHRIGESVVRRWFSVTLLCLDVVLDIFICPRASTEDVGPVHNHCNYVSFVPQSLVPNSKAHGANMGPTWGRQDPGGSHVGHMNLAILGMLKCRYRICLDRNFVHTSKIFSSWDFYVRFGKYALDCAAVSVFIDM